MPCNSVQQNQEDQRCLSVCDCPSGLGGVECCTGCDCGEGILVVLILIFVVLIIIYCILYFNYFFKTLQCVTLQNFGGRICGSRSFSNSICNLCLKNLPINNCFCINVEITALI